jgi:hypothetical protein
MHISKRFHVALSLFLGFCASFLLLAGSLVLQKFSNLQGQLVAGDTEQNRALPTTLNMLRGAADGTDPIMQPLMSFGFWIAVVLFGIVGTFMAFRLMRRFV